MEGCVSLSSFPLCFGFGCKGKSMTHEPNPNAKDKEESTHNSFRFPSFFLSFRFVLSLQPKWKEMKEEKGKRQRNIMWCSFFSLLCVHFAYNEMNKRRRENEHTTFYSTWQKVQPGRNRRAKGRDQQQKDDWKVKVII